MSAAADSSSQAEQYAYWQRRIMLATIVGYALYYFVRKNLSVAMPVMETSLGVTKSKLGLFITAHGILYGVSKFVHGIIGDRVNARWFMTSGLVVCGLINLAFGFSSTVIALGLLWAANGWFQGMGYPPCARLITHWFPPRRLASSMAFWNISHSLGAGAIVVLCGYLAPIDWRLCFFVPAGIVLVGAVWLAVMLRDTPESLGLPPVEGDDHVVSEVQPLLSTLRQRVLSNPHIWLLSFANFFVYSVRYGILDWGPSFLKQDRGIDLSSGAWIVAAFEGCGLLGILCGGWITDRVFAGRAPRACVFYMAACTVTMLLFWRLPNQTRFTSTALLCLAGFCVYGPQSLIGAAAANLATKRAAAASVGLTGLFGYLSTIVSGWGVGALVQRHGWDAGFLLFVVCSVIGTLLFALCWGAKAHGYD